MAHPNDTLHGKLYAFEREDEKHLRRSFGYWRMVEERMIRDQITAEGGDPTDLFEVSRRVIQNHKSDPTLREQQEAARAVRGNAPDLTDIRFSDEEMEEIIERFGGSNTEVGQSIFKKAWATMVRRQMKENAA